MWGDVQEKLYLVYKVALSIQPWFLGGFLSLKRIGGMHLIKILPIKNKTRSDFFSFSFYLIIFWNI